MRTRNWVCLALAALCLTGCSGFWKASSNGGGSGGGGGTTLSSGNFYVINSATNEIAGLYVKAGTVTALGSSSKLAASPIAVTVAPNNAFLYVSTLGGIFVYTIDATSGQLTVGNSGQPISSDPATTMQVDSTNSWLVEGFSGTSNLFAIHVNPSTGVLQSNQEQPVALPSSAITQVAISPDNTTVLAALGSGGTATIPFNAAGANPFGAVGILGVKNTGGAALSVAFDPIPTGANAPRLFYIGETVAVGATSTDANTGGLRAFTYSNKQEITGSPFRISGLAPYAILPFSGGSYVYVLNRQTASNSTGVIAGFSIATTNNVLGLTALGSTFKAGTNPQMLVEDNTKQFVFAVNFGGNPDLLGYTIDTKNAGYLVQSISSQTGTDPVQANSIAAAH
ncbi:beta-propeller fold lactonase family protein [Occallatibacter savannae]|uniref:beta-propeller fold lactonase family protein n=1 Tax=Occallatibacter savannae TaxID=1002691 RepID=UPI000D68FFB5|nr:beta-propeller fold lactonase family protein [Occallatibacter savannae]